MKKGDIVMIYEDPITRQRPEGEAVLFEPISQDDYDIRNRLERWGVVFVPDGLEDPDRTMYERVILSEVTA